MCVLHCVWCLYLRNKVNYMCCTYAGGKNTAVLKGKKYMWSDPNITLQNSQTINNTSLWINNWPSHARERLCVCMSPCSVCFLCSTASLMLSGMLSGVVHRFGRCQSASASHRAGCCRSAHWGMPGRHWVPEASASPEEKAGWELKTKKIFVQTKLFTSWFLSLSSTWEKGTNLLNYFLYLQWSWVSTAYYCRDLHFSRTNYIFDNFSIITDESAPNFDNFHVPISFIRFPASLSDEKLLGNPLGG